MLYTLQPNQAPRTSQPREKAHPLYLCLIILSSPLFALITKLTVFVKIAAVKEGFDPQTKTVMVIDCKEIGGSPVTLESKTGSFTVDVPAGNP
ncbi:hypothetical protein [Algoriphagus sp. AK58]|uniref:hypothetical protein n=1 Tax=Algoriphagus sp. AK58 TaxID=1406877 RepID=UPI0016507A7E|nr:hypothetical protein [Algoriphagus sp. AK58]MBC6368003.1 hypothetical protein [Algoriphagus sp. AK58]